MIWWVKRVTGSIHPPVSFFIGANGWSSLKVMTEFDAEKRVTVLSVDHTVQGDASHVMFFWLWPIELSLSDAFSACPCWLTGVFDSTATVVPRSSSRIFGLSSPVNEMMMLICVCEASKNAAATKDTMPRGLLNVKNRRGRVPSWALIAILPSKW